MRTSSSFGAFPRTASRALAPWALALLLGCTGLTAPSGEEQLDPSEVKTAVQLKAGQTNEVTPTEPVAPPKPAAPSPAAKEEVVTASHLLVAYDGARRAPKGIQRTKEEARRRAEALLKRAQQGEDFKKLAKAESDDPTAKGNGGSLGTFPRRAMVKPFADAAFALEPGGLSQVVETPFGFHIIRREK